MAFLMRKKGQRLVRQVKVISGDSGGFFGAALVRPAHHLWDQGLAWHAAKVTDWTEKHPTCLGWHPELTSISS